MTAHHRAQTRDHPSRSTAITILGFLESNHQQKSTSAPRPTPSADPLPPLPFPRSPDFQQPLVNHHLSACKDVDIRACGESTCLPDISFLARKRRRRTRWRERETRRRAKWRVKRSEDEEEGAGGGCRREGAPEADTALLHRSLSMARDISLVAWPRPWPSSFSTARRLSL